ncbi:cytochrome P450 [Suillus decipiens]|nr:cytochrome P450 [Suillus decipiens]
MYFYVSDGVQSLVQAKREDSASLTIARWIDEYGPLVTIRSGTQTIVIIGRYKAAVDIMEKQAKILADRPRLVSGEILTRGLNITLAHARDKFRPMYRALHTYLQPKSAEAYQPLQMSQAKNVIFNILDDPHNFQHHVGTYAATTIMKVIYGKTAPTTVPEIRDALQLTETFPAVLHHGNYLVNSMSWLKHLPWYAPELKDRFERTRRLYIGQLNRVRQQLSNKDISPSFAKCILETGRVYDLTETEMAYLAGALFRPGFHTTAIAICTVLMAAAYFPEEQAKVQAELDAVIGRERAPTFADKPSLPRLEAFISEALRWRPLVPEGLPHRTTEEVIWANYCIPAGTTVIGNHWAISRDPEVYPEPDAFKPQRWVDDQGRLRDDLTFSVYGFGQRVCPGQHVANRSVFINSLLIFWAFELSLDPMQPQDDMGFTKR